MKKEEFMKQSADSMSISELAEAIKLKSVLRTELKVGDRVEIIQYWKSGSPCSFDGRKGNFIKRQNDEFQVELDDQVELYDGVILAAYKVKKVSEKPKAEWTDITKECELSFQESKILKGFAIDLEYKGRWVATIMSDDGLDKRPINVSCTCKVEYAKNSNHFKIMRRE